MIKIYVKTVLVASLFKNYDKYNIFPIKYSPDKSLLVNSKAGATVDFSAEILYWNERKLDDSVDDEIIQVGQSMLFSSKIFQAV